MAKKTPKNSKSPEKAKERKEKTAIIVIFIIFIAVVAYLFYMLKIPSSNKDIVATINGNDITAKELDWWYKISISPESRGIIPKQNFLMFSLIPQELLMQEAEKENIKVTAEDIEEFVGLYIIETGLSLDEFEKNLESMDLAIEDIKKSFETKAAIVKLLKEKNIDSINNSFEESSELFQEYVSNLINNSEIKIFPENIGKLILTRFELTGDEICGKEKPIVRLYTTSKCDVCNKTGDAFINSIENYVKTGKIEAHYWNLDTGDDLLTLKKENGVPEEEVAIFKKYSPGKLVPVVVLGCKYRHIGKLEIEGEEEFMDILNTIAGN